MLKIGYHVSVAGGLSLAFDRAQALGCTAMQIFVTNPRTWKFSVVTEEDAKAFREKARSHNISVVVHMPYLPNLASSNRIIFEKSLNSLRQNITRCSELGIGYLVAHLGSHMGHGKEKGLANILRAIGEVSPMLSETMLLLENEAGQNNSVGSDVLDLAYIYDNAQSKRIGFCLDTCHLFAAGYDVRKAEVLDRIDSGLGLDKVHALHFNDAKFGLGSGRDRHDNIGLGMIGEDGFRNMLSRDSIASKVLILETPFNEKLKEGEEMAALRKLSK